MGLFNKLKISKLALRILFCGELRLHVEPEYEKLKILSEYIIWFSEWLKKERILK